MIIAGFSMVMNSSYKVFYYSQNELGSLSQAATIMRDFEKTTRGASKIEENTANTLTFYAYQKGDNYPAPSKISYYFEGDTLKKSVIPPTAVSDGKYSYGSTPIITAFAGTITAHNIFTYYDKNYTGTENPLSQPISPATILIIKIDVIVNGKGTAKETTMVELRNLKTNL